MTKSVTFIAIAATLVSAALVSAVHANGKKRVTTVGGIEWRNSLQDALAESKRTGKPVLLLSMFGRIDEAMPCANARTLRATLFKEKEFKNLVTQDVIPAWEMVRPVPKVEIDFGNGKKLVRTVRGNAVMYLVNSKGKVFDAFPGVYTKSDFMPRVRESIATLAKADERAVNRYHWARSVPPQRTSATLGKTVLESPTLDLIGARAEPLANSYSMELPRPGRSRFDIAALGVSDTSLRPMPMRQAIRTVTGKPMEAHNRKSLPLDVIRIDSRTNVSRVRPVIHAWLGGRDGLPTPKQARDDVLVTILKIPYKDPFFGLKDVVLPGTPE